MSGIKWSIQETEIIQNNYSCLEKDKLRDLLSNRTWTAIKLKAKELGIKRRINEIPKCSNLNLLLENTPETYYWIGFLLADGTFSTNRIKIGLAKKDSNHVMKLRNYLSYEGDLQNHYFGCMDNNLVPLIMKKFDINQNKTYHPPRIEIMDEIKNDDLFTSLVIGLIDGDGCIIHQYKRKDSRITIKLHKSWELFLQYVANRIYKILQRDDTIKTRTVQKKYVQICFSNSQVVKFLKQKSLLLNLPYLERKWSRIDADYVSKIEIAEKRKKQIQKMLDGDYANSQICAKLNISASSLCNTIKRNRMRRYNDRNKK